LVILRHNNKVVSQIRQILIKTEMVICSS